MDFKNPIHFRTLHRATFFEIDPYGHMSTTHYLTYFLEHRFTGLREEIGYDLKTLAELPVGFYTNKIEIEFLRPIMGDETFEIDSHTAETSETSCLIRGEARKKDGKIAARFVMSLVCVDKKSQRPCTWPEGVLSRFFAQA